MMKKITACVILVAAVLSVFAGLNKTVYFEISDINGLPYNFEIQPFDDVIFFGWIEGREDEVISSRDSLGVGYFSNKDFSKVYINAAYFPTPWQIGDILKIQCMEKDSSDNIAYGSKSVSFQIANYDDIEEHDGKSRLDLLANEVYVDNLTIDYSSDHPILTWVDKVFGPADFFYIMKSEDPYASVDSDSWTPAVTDLQTNTWTDIKSVDLGKNKMFYRVIFIYQCPSDMVVIPQGSFVMGQDGVTNATPEHEVTLTKSIFMGKYEVTQSEWLLYMPAYSGGYAYGSGDNYPVYYVSWYAALKYCNLISMARDLTPCYTINNSIDPADWGSVPTSSNALWNAVTCNFEANGFRLPTEAEWEFAARYTDERTYPWGPSAPDGTLCNFNGNVNSATGVGSYSAGNSFFGLCDMAGNIAEFVWDWYSAYTIAPLTDPVGPASGTAKIYRSGTWGSTADAVKSAYRVSINPYSAFSGTGFRVVRLP
jgi:formylglycine-generating enzyme required for sulfatase activity